MQRIEYRTDFGTITADDVNTGSISGLPCVVWLNDFDGNSLAMKEDVAECIGVPGQILFSKIAKPRVIIAKLGFVPTGNISQYELRREVLRLFSLEKAGTLTYSNDSGEYHIDARVTDVTPTKYIAGSWAEITVCFTADYPYWEYPMFESETVSGGELVLAGRCDIDSPLEIIVHAVTDVTDFAVWDAEHSGSYWYGFHVPHLSAGSGIVLDSGTKGYIKVNEWTSYRGNERLVCNKPGGNTLVFSANGDFTAKVRYHNIALTV